jgi:hypothetical protein
VYRVFCSGFDFLKGAIPMVLAVLVAVHGTVQAHAAAAIPIQNELRRLNKCYGQFVGVRIKTSDPLWQQVAAGTMSGVDACMNVFHRGDLGSDGRISQVAGEYDPVGSQVLSRFLEFYRSTFYVTDIATSAGFQPDLYDANAPAFHFLYSAFKPGEAYSNSVRRSQGLRAYRLSSRTGPRTRSVIGLKPLVQYQQGNTADGAQTILNFNPTLVETGRLIGIRPDEVSNVATAMQWKRVSFQGRNVSASMGAGFMGEQTYLTANNNQDGVWANNNGTIRIFRVWARSVLNDALGRSLPVLRVSDVTSEVEVSSDIPWRQGRSCMSCHDSMDHAAGAIRNLARLRTTDGGEGQVRFWVNFVSPSEPAAPLPRTGLDNGDFWYFKRPADFKLRFRSYDGTLVDVSGTGLAALAEKIAATNDFYASAAKRHYEFLTGISANLDDITDPDAIVPTPAELNARNRVIELGAALKNHQSLPELVRSILALPEYLDQSAVKAGGGK